MDRHDNSNDSGEEHRGESPHGELDPEDMSNRYWFLFGAVQFTILSTVLAAFDLYVLTGFDITGNQPVVVAITVVNLAIAWVAGGFLEYCRLRIAHDYGGNDAAL